MKNKRLIRPYIQVKKSDIHRYGAFATKYFAAGEIIEEAPVVLLNNSDYSPTLDNYVFTWGKPDTYALVLGYGSIYNHSDTPNMKYNMDAENELMIYSAIRPIFKGEELFIFYSEQWFKLRNLEKRRTKNKYTIMRTLHLIFWTLVLFGMLILVTIMNH